MSAKLSGLRRVAISSQERRDILLRSLGPLDNISRIPPGTVTDGYAWILRHKDGWYVDGVGGILFTYSKSQKAAVRFSNRRAALDAMLECDARIPHIPSIRYVVRVVRLKLKEKT